MFELTKQAYCFWCFEELTADCKFEFFGLFKCPYSLKNPVISDHLEKYNKSSCKLKWAYIVKFSFCRAQPRPFDLYGGNFLMLYNLGFCSIFKITKRTNAGIPMRLGFSV